MNTIYRLISVWVLILVGSLFLPLVSVVAASSTTYETSYASTTTPATDVEHLAAIDTGNGSDTSLQSIASSQACCFLDFGRNFNAPRTPTTRALASPWPHNRGFLGNPKQATLKPGTMIDRYGFEGGTFASPKGTPYANRALHPSSASKPYNVYEVVKPLDVNTGRAAPWFGEPGLGIQHELPSSVGTLIEQGILKRVP